MHPPISATPTILFKGDDGQEYRFGRLHFAEWAELQTELEDTHKQQRNHWVMTLKQHGLDVSQIPALIRQLERIPTFTEVERYGLSIKGAMSVLRKAAKLAGWTLTDDRFIQIGSVDALCGLAARLMGLVAEDEGEVPPLAGTSSPATTDSTP